MLRMCAMSVGKTSTALGAFYRRLAYRVGKAKAITATARKLAILVYRVLRGDIEYAGVDAYEAQHRTRARRNLRTRAQHLGLGLIDLENRRAPGARSFLRVSPSYAASCLPAKLLI